LSRFLQRQMDDAKVAYDALNREHSEVKLEVATLKSTITKARRTEGSLKANIEEWESRFLRESELTGEMKRKVQELTGSLNWRLQTGLRG